MVSPSFGRASIPVLLILTCLADLSAASASCRCSSGAPRLERSYWIHASLGANLSKGYWAENSKPDSSLPTAAEIRNAAGLLTGRYAANRLYLLYHNEVPIREFGRLLRGWRSACPTEAELVPALLLKRFDKAQGDVFSEPEFARLCGLLKGMDFGKVAVYDVVPNRDAGKWLSRLAELFPDGLIRVGIQPEEAAIPPFVEAVQDTWTGVCWGKTNEDWRMPGYGSDMLRGWVTARNTGGVRIAWDLIAVAWDYSATEHGEYPGYDDASKNMALPPDRNRLAAREILVTASPRALAGFSSDLLILEWNSRTNLRDGRAQSFYERLKKGEQYEGYFAEPLDEIASIYADLRAGRLPCR